ncbi:hypothetical protein BDN72DRAFT_830890 [Pluteus cervinus]|uniref:Uncharacterized protein n=1 Tax=Pluteus cervinus TaxID=181527 RepID=A0ACD3BE15_9AGAR|nr:hypothetical protein BDN72DRAFT_830890 [Pluteus cervinus]
MLLVRPPVLVLALAMNAAQSVRSSPIRNGTIVCSDELDWLNNSRGQTPCAVAEDLQSICLGNNTRYIIPPLPGHAHYTGPTPEQANDCQCSSVIYALVSACAACQERSFLSFISWAANCHRTDLNKFNHPVQQDTVIPAWAYSIDLQRNTSFDLEIAKALATSNTSDLEIASTSVISPTNTSTPIAAEAAATNESNIANDPRAWIISELVLGITLFASLVACVVFWGRLRRYQRSILLYRRYTDSMSGSDKELIPLSESFTSDSEPLKQPYHTRPEPLSRHHEPGTSTISIPSQIECPSSTTSEFPLSPAVQSSTCQFSDETLDLQRHEARNRDLENYGTA